MARAYARDGVEPTRTRTVKRDDGVDLELPYCNICGEEMDGVRLSALLVWKPGFNYTRKFPLRYGAFLCESCREEEGFGAEQYIAVPCPSGVEMIDALKEFLAVMEGAGND